MSKVQITTIHDSTQFSTFEERLPTDLASKAIRVTFECDDCDPLAMQLMACTKAKIDFSFNTYVLDCKYLPNE